MLINCIQVIKKVTKYTLKEDLNKIINQCGFQLFKNEKC